MLRRISAWWAETLAISGKELVELRRQPRALVLIVLGPFLVLAAFGLGYRNEELALRTVIVEPRDSNYRDAFDRYAGAIDDYVVPLAFTSDFFAAVDDLRAGRADLVIVLPPNPVDAIADNRQSEIAVLHDSIDPIERVGIDFAAEVAVRELNATVVTSSLSALLDTFDQLDVQIGDLIPIVDEIAVAAEAGDSTQTAAGVVVLRAQLDELRPALDLSFGAPSDGERNAESETLAAIDERLDRIADGDGSVEDLAALRREIGDVEQRVGMLLALDAATLARPFVGDAESLTRESVTAEDHVAPGATALLIQHLSVSLAALSVGRDRRRGILTDYQVGPVGVVSVMSAKLIAASAVGLMSALVLVGAQVWLLGVPRRGSVAAMVAILCGLVVASVAVGLVVASLSRSELEASQSAMILLLVALFFSGFLLDLDRIREPFASIGWLAPATPAVGGLRDVVLRGRSADWQVAAILGAQAFVGVSVASALLARNWRRGR